MDRQALIDFLTWVRNQGESSDDYPEIVIRRWNRYKVDWDTYNIADGTIETFVDAYLASQEAARAKVWGEINE